MDMQTLIHFARAQMEGTAYSTFHSQGGHSRPTSKSLPCPQK